MKKPCIYILEVSYKASVSILDLQWSDSKRDDWHNTFRSLFIRDAGIRCVCPSRVDTQRPGPLLPPMGWATDAELGSVSAGDQTPLPDPRSGGATGWGAAHPGVWGVCGARNVSKSPPSY